MTEEEIRQLFKNNSDCYADTWHIDEEDISEGEVVQAMTEDVFIKLFEEQVKKALDEQIKKIDDLVLFCEVRNNYQSDGNEFAPSFIERLKQLKP